MFGMDDDLPVVALIGDNPTYKARTETLLRRYAKVKGLSYFDGTAAYLSGFAEWLANEERPRLSPDSWRAYRYQVMQVLPYREVTTCISVPPLNSSRDLPKKTSRQRPRHFKQEAIQRLEDTLLRSSSIYAEHLVRLIKCTVLLGVRPKEWYGAVLESNEYSDYLRVRTAQKGTRFHAPLAGDRLLPVSHFSQDELSMLNAWMAKVATMESLSEYEKFMDSLVHTLKRVTAIIFRDEPRPTIYSARSQFSANLKFTGFDSQLIAVALGHADLDTQTRYYGRTVNGYYTQMDEELLRKLNA